MKIFLVLFLFSMSALASNHARLSNIKTINRFVFGSCNNQNKPQPLWNEILKQNPDLFIWGGDIVYADKEKPTNLALALSKQNQIKDWMNFKSKIPIIGTWDDHDYGVNDGDGTYTGKDEAKKLLLDFLEEPQNSPRRKQEGLYASYTFGKVKFILLDNRYFMKLDPNAQMLGEKQWKWLENEIHNTKAKVTFIVSSLSIFSPKFPGGEGWPFIPSETDRLLDLVERQNNTGVVFLTGDMHFSSIFKRRNHLEFLSSGLTHSVPTVIRWYISRFFENTYYGLSYGQVDIAWERDTPIITTTIRNHLGKDIHKKVFRLEANEWIEQ